MWSRLVSQNPRELRRLNVKREALEGWLRAAAAANGLPVDRVGTHSLRVGGATALYNAGWELAAVQRFGRWASGAFHGYLWDTHDLTRGAAGAMVSGDRALHLGVLQQPSDMQKARANPARRSEAWARAVSKFGSGGVGLHQ